MFGLNYTNRTGLVSVMITVDQYLFNLFLCNPIAREWYPCDVALPIVSILCTHPKGYGAVLYIPERSQGIAMRNWKGHGAVSTVTIMTIQLNDSNRGSTPRVWNDYTIL